MSKLYFGSQEVMPHISVEEIKNIPITLTPSLSSQILTPPSNYTGYGTITVNPVSSSVDNNIQSGNITQGTTILGVEGTFVALRAQEKDYALNTNMTSISPSQGYNAMSKLSINAILDTTTLQDVHFTRNTQTITPDNAPALGSFTIPGYSLEEKTIRQNGEYSSQNYDGFSSVVVSVNTNLGTKTINSDDTYNAIDDNCAGYSSVTVNVPTPTKIPRVVEDGVYKAPSTPFAFEMNAKNISGRRLAYGLYGSSGLTKVSMPNLESLGLNGDNTNGDTLDNTFTNCSNLSVIEFPRLFSVGRQAFNNTFSGCTSLTSVDLSSISTVDGYACFNSAFYLCSNLESVDFSGLTYVNGQQAFANCFLNCTRLHEVLFTNLESIGDSSHGNSPVFQQTFSSTNVKSLEFPKLTSIYCNGSNYSYGTFYGNTSIQKFYFPKLSTITYTSTATSSEQSAYLYIFYGCSALTEIHFGAVNQAAIESNPGYSTLWGRGAGNATVYFDL